MEKLKRSELIQKAKDMKLGGYSKLKKKALIELINSHPSPPSHAPPEVKIEGKEKMQNEKDLISFSLQPSSSQHPALIKEVERLEKIVKDMTIILARFVGVINNPPSPPSHLPTEGEIKGTLLLEQRPTANEMKLQGCSELNKKELVAPQAEKERRKVTLISESGEELMFFSIHAAAKYFGINSGRFGVKLHAKSEKARNSITIKGTLYQLHIE